MKCFVSKRGTKIWVGHVLRGMILEDGMTLEYSSLVTFRESVPNVRLERSVPELTRVGKVGSLTVDLAKCRARLAVFARQDVE